MRKLLFNIWMLIPFGFLLRFEYGSMPGGYQRVTLTKELWVVVDGGKGTAKDALPLYFVSQNLVDECERRIVEKYKLQGVA